MFDRLIELVRASNAETDIRIHITYSPITDWSVEVKDTNDVVINCQDADPYVVASKVYLLLSDYMLKVYGGY